MCARQARELREGASWTVPEIDHTVELQVDCEVVAVVPRTTNREIHRYKAYATRREQASDFRQA